MTGLLARPRKCGAALAGAFLGIALAFATSPAASSEDAEEKSRPPRDRGEIHLTFAEAVRRAAPSVVSIYARRIVAERFDPFGQHPFFREFFRGHRNRFGTRSRERNSLGSGVVVRADGIVITARHLIAGAEEIRVVLADRREFEAEVLLADARADLAVLRLVDAEGLPTLPFRDAFELEVGDLVLAIGNPMGIGQTVTSGIVSAVARADGSGRYLLQTDAAINVGNSGGALIDARGEVVGINTAILTRGGGSDGIGFAVPSNLAERAVESALAGEKQIARPWTGMSLAEIDADMAEAMGLAVPRGVLVAEVDARSAFAESGLRQGDVLIALDGVAVNAPHEIEYRLALLGPGRRMRVHFTRGGEDRFAEVRLAGAPDRPAATPYQFDSGAGPFAGATLANANPAVIESLGLASYAARGVIVTATRARAARWLQPGDLVRRLGGERVESVREMRERISQVRGIWRVEIERNGQRIRFSFSG